MSVEVSFAAGKTAIFFGCSVRPVGVLLRSVDRLSADSVCVRMLCATRDGREKALLLVDFVLRGFTGLPATAMCTGVFIRYAGVTRQCGGAELAGNLMDLARSMAVRELGL